MKTKWVELPIKLTNNFLTFQFLAQLSKSIEHLENENLKISFKKNHFIQPTVIACLGLLLYEAKSKGNKVQLYFIKKEIKILLENYELIPSKNKAVANVKGTPFRIFENGDKDEFEKYLNEMMDSKNPLKEIEYIATYIKRIFEIFEKNIATNSFYNSNMDWLFFSIATSNVIELNDYSIHLLIEELLLTGGNLWIAHKNIYYDLKEIKRLKDEINYTLLIVGFPFKK